MRLNKISLACLVLGGSALLTACGGDVGSPAIPTLPTMSGMVVNSYVYGAVVTLDTNDDGVCQSTEPQVVSSLTGAYSFPGLGSHMVCSKGGYNTDTKLPMTGEFKAPVGATVMTALSTLLVAQLPVKPTAAQVTAAQSKLESQLSLPAGSINLDPVASIATSPKIEQANAAIQVLLQTAARSVAAFASVAAPTATTSPADKAKYEAAVNAVYASAVKAVANAVDIAAAPIDLSDAAKSAQTATFVQTVVQKTLVSVIATPAIVATLATVAPETAARITTVSADNAAAFVSSSISTLVQSVAQTSGTRAAITAASLNANSNTAVVNVVEDVKTIAPTLFATGAPPAITQMAALAEAFLPKTSVVANSPVTVNTVTATTALTAVAAIVDTTLNVATTVTAVAAQVLTPPVAPVQVVLTTVTLPTVAPLPPPVTVVTVVTGAGG